MNAGIMACPFGKTEDGLERQFGASLRDRLESVPAGRLWATAR